MKNVFIGLIALFSAQAFASVNANSSWAEIFANKDITVSAPQIAFGAPAGFAGTTYVPVYATCLAGDTFKTTSELPTYKYVYVGGQDSDLVQVGTAILTTNRTFLKDVAGPNDTEYQVNYTYGLDYTLEVLENSSRGGENDPAVLFTKAFTIPNCVK